MRKLIVFNQVSLDGYFTDANNDLSWAHSRDNTDPEWKAFVESNASGGGELLFGRITYEMMKSYWPTPAAVKNDPVVAEGMNNLPKVVFSKTMDKASWNNPKVVKGDLPAEIRKMKAASGKDMVLMGSGTIVSQLTQEGLIDEYQFVIIPVVLGKGRTMFDGVRNKPTMKPTTTRTFANGNVFLTYEPTGSGGAQ
jgi:dihydrofolate reductase